MTIGGQPRGPRNAADIQGRCTHQRMETRLEVELFQRNGRACDLVDRVVALLGHRAMRGDAPGFGRQPERALVAEQRHVAGGLGHHECAGAAEQLTRLRRDGHCEGAFTAGFLAGSDDQAQARASGTVAQAARLGDRRAGEGRDAALHVAGAPTIEPAIEGFGSERVVLPSRVAQRHHVDMARKGQRCNPASSLQPAADARHQAGAARRGANAWVWQAKPAADSRSASNSTQRSSWPGGLMVSTRTRARVSATGSGSVMRASCSSEVHRTQFFVVVQCAALPASAAVGGHSPSAAFEQADSARSSPANGRC
jgi:hypothetical protein